MQQTVIQNPTWRKRHPVLARGSPIAVSGVLLRITLAVGMGVIVSECKVFEIEDPSAVLAAPEMLPSTTGPSDDQENDRQMQTTSEPTDPGDYCLTPGCVRAAEPVIKNSNFSVDPCDDFYRFACGGFLKDTVIPNGQNQVARTSMFETKVLQQVNSSIQAEIKPNEKKHTKLVKQIYKLCSDTDAIESQGLEPLLKVLKKLGGWPVLEGDSWNDRDFDWIDWTYKARDAGYVSKFFIHLGTAPDQHNNTKKMALLDTTMLGCSRESLSKGIRNKVVRTYYKYMVDIAVILGADRTRAEKELYDSLTFEMKLESIAETARSARNEMFAPMTFAELIKRCPKIPWKEYFRRMMAPSIVIEDNEVLMVYVPDYYCKLEILMSETPKRMQANYVMWRTIADSMAYLTNDLRKRELAYLDAIKRPKKSVPRWQECHDFVDRYLWFAVDAMYVEEYVDKETKKNVKEIAKDIKEQFTKILETAEWIDEETRKDVSKKAATITMHIGYPDELPDDEKLEKRYEKLEFSGHSYLESYLNLSLYEHQRDFGSLREPIRKSHWTTRQRAIIPRTWFNPSENSIYITASLLQDPNFSNDRPRYMNYGAIGVIIGQTIADSFSRIGEIFDMYLNRVGWWSHSARKKYLKRSKCIINQYDNYTAEEVGISIRGGKTKPENIAINGGVKVAYLAYKNWVAKHGPEKKMSGISMSSEKMFWMSTVNNWCSKYTPRGLTIKINKGISAPEEFRTIGTLSNMPEFAKDFVCPEGSRMNPEEKCLVW